MPDLETHCRDCERKIGKPFPEVHRWLDALCTGDFEHRDIRHNLVGVEEVRVMYGDEAAEAAKLHIRLDWGGILECEIPENEADAIQFRLRIVREFRERYERDKNKADNR